MKPQSAKRKQDLFKLSKCYPSYLNNNNNNNSNNNNNNNVSYQEHFCPQFALHYDKKNLESM